MAKPIIGVLILAGIVFVIAMLFTSILVVNEYEEHLKEETPLAVIEIVEGETANIQFTSPGNHTIIFARATGEIVKNLTIHSENEENSIFQKTHTIDGKDLTSTTVAYIEIDDNVYPVQWYVIRKTVAKRFTTFETVVISAILGGVGFAIGFIATKGGKIPLLSE